MFDTRPSFDFGSYPYDFDTNLQVVEGEVMIFHCHHYNTFLQRSILDAEYIDSRPILVGAAAEIVFSQLAGIFRGISDRTTRARVAQELYRLCGFGLLPLEALTPDGGTLRTRSTHYSLGWKEKFGPASSPVAYFSAGFLAGAFAAIHDLPLAEVDAVQRECVSMGASEDVFEVRPGKSRFALFPARASLPTRPVVAPEALPTEVDRDGITRAVTTLPLLGNDAGLIPAFGVYLTRMYADYYNRISYAFEHLMIDAVGAEGLEVSRSLFIEAGRVCSFNTFGGIMTSTEWDALILPYLQTREDWVHAMVAVVNALGWGTWTVAEVGPDGARFRICNDYESLGYQRMYGTADHPVSYLAQGGVAGLMNLVYLGDIHTHPDLTPEYYQRLFKGKGVYESRIETCQAQGQPYTEIVAWRGQ